MELADIADKFWSRVDKSGECWNWTSSCTKAGYGQIQARKVHPAPILAHRVSWILTFGPIPPGGHVLHRCDNPPCVNPDHLFIGDQRTNNSDRTAKGRTASGDRNGSRTRPDRRANGERCGSSKLTVDMVRSIRSAVGTQREIAAEFKISQQQVSMIVTRKHWKHVP